VRGALGWLLVAAAVAFAARLAGALQDYALRLLTQTVGTEMFDDGLRHTLRLPFQDMADRSSGETVALLQKLRTDTERFLNATVNVLYASLVGVGFLVWFGVTRHWLLIPVSASASWCSAGSPACSAARSSPPSAPSWARPRGCRARSRSRCATSSS